jgi:hypothetical protein
VGGRARAGRTVVVVSDNGVGGATMSAGTGLAGLVDRVEALGGRLDVESPAPGGYANHRRGSSTDLRLIRSSIRSRHNLFECLGGDAVAVGVEVDVGSVRRRCAQPGELAEAQHIERDAVH